MLVVSHILLGSRALTTEELIVTLQQLAAGLPPTMRDELHKNLTLAKGSYTPLSKPVPLLKRVHQMTIYINANQKLVFVYRNSNPHVTKPQVHHAQPVAVFFEQHYFYVGMLSEEHHGYWLYRLDRIIEVLSVQSGQKLDYAHRFSLQDHRHQSYLLDSGSLTPIRFIYRYALQTALDYFPTAKVLETKEDGSHIIEAYVKVDGAMLWLLSQGTGVQILSPLSLVNRMKTALMKTLEQYR
ncbi:WYL domain-containing protein [Lactiplantibacillus pentosus]|nr:WYL domain-containing protein [Lactiplantibacillus pentosus]